MSTKPSSSSENPAPEIQYPAARDGEYLELSHSQQWEIVEGEPDGDHVVPSSQPDQDYSYPPQFLSRYLNSSTTHDVHSPSRRARADSKESIVSESEAYSDTDDEEDLSLEATGMRRNTSRLSEQNASQSSQPMLISDFPSNLSWLGGDREELQEACIPDGPVKGSSSQYDDGPTAQRPLEMLQGVVALSKDLTVWKA
ncbi:hypothetical protein BDP27DRAFT_1424982 [Rhodocollybia butyracea]|uniref:Uncharacterized protein n=1 Tax=Rhodocollybia butyracea TaxID=206335 RepID=A0A9P5PMM0_9AGAR|nr:hypothetical protein BDP27DRAFT_1424982 [Rhodocollybia butyracea]